MPWNIIKGTDMRDACRELPGTASGNQGCDIPDVYGRAIQLYLDLERSARESDYRTEAVVMWRALLAMLALRNLLDLPLVWEHIQLESSNLFSDALQKPPRNRDLLLYPNRAEYQWNGHSFYVLQWAPNGQNPIDLAVYSPMTLLYPVADWREIFAGISLLRKFFNARTRSFQEHRYCLLDGELDFVYLWLRDMKESLETDEGDSTAKHFILMHLTQYMEELLRRDNSLAQKGLPLHSLKFGYTAQLESLVPTLTTAYDIGSPVFSDQICVLRVDAKYGNPFVPCDYCCNYEIKGRLESDVNMYAFLPIHPSRRAQCRENGLAESITMQLRRMGEEVYIRVSASLSDLPGILLEKEYLLVEKDYPLESEAGEPDTLERDIAVFYKDEYNRNVVLNKHIWPLFSVWPSTLDANWNQYYVMRSSEHDCLRICGEYDAPSVAGYDGKAEKGDSRVVVKIPYVPDAIPLIRMLRDEDGRLTNHGVTVGMVTPRRTISARSAASAIVSVDFDTISTRAFYTLSGNEQDVEEINVTRDTPLEVTLYNNSVDRRLEMSTYFISPIHDDEKLHSIFRRAEAKNRDAVRPLLDGCIYQPSGFVTPESTLYLVTDLKWNRTITRPYFIAFMQQFCLHIMTWLYQKHQIIGIEWRYALPETTREIERAIVSSIWNNDILGYLRSVSGDTVTHTVAEPVLNGHSCPKLPVLTKSAAVSRYFASSVNPRKGYLVIDIGAERTEASLWQQVEKDSNISLKWRSSINVAKRRMFTRWIEDNIEDMTAGINDSSIYNFVATIRIRDFSKHQDPGAREALVDYLLTAHNMEILANYTANIDTQPDQWGGILLNKLTQAVSLLLFALGYQVGSLIRADRFRIPPGPGGYFTIAIGGYSLFRVGEAYRGGSSRCSKAPDSLSLAVLF